MEKLIEKIKTLSIYKNTSYYTFHLGMPLWRHFSGTKWNGIPYCLKAFCIEVKHLISESRLSQEEIVHYISHQNSNPSYFFVAQCIYCGKRSLFDRERSMQLI